MVLKIETEMITLIKFEFNQKNSTIKGITTEGKPLNCNNILRQNPSDKFIYSHIVKNEQTIMVELFGTCDYQLLNDDNTESIINLKILKNTKHDVLFLVNQLELENNFTSLN